MLFCGRNASGRSFDNFFGCTTRGFILIVTCFVSAIGLLLVATIPFYYAAVVFMLIIGLGDAGRRNLNMALIMEITEDQYRGRVMSVFMMNFGLIPLGVLPMAIVADLVGAQVAVGLFATLLLVTSSAIFATQRRLRERK